MPSKSTGFHKRAEIYWRHKLPSWSAYLRGNDTLKRVGADRHLSSAHTHNNTLVIAQLHPNIQLIFDFVFLETFGLIPLNPIIDN